MSGLLNKLLADNTIQLAGTVPGGASNYASVNILVINPNPTDGLVTAYATTSPSASAVDKIMHERVMAANGGQIEIACRIMSGGEKIYVKAPVGCIVRIELVEENL